MQKILKKVRFADEKSVNLTNSLQKLPTVCDHSRCPNKPECFSSGVATYLVMGEICTRNCRYCHISRGKPDPLDPNEKFRLREAIGGFRASHIVLTCVERDDLPDGGASHLVEIANFLKNRLSTPGEDIDKNMKLEILLPDFRGKQDSWNTMSKAPLDVFSHNMEAVPTVFAKIRPGGNWKRSLDFLSFLSSRPSGPIIKSGFMVGFGEKPREVFELMDFLGASGVRALTIGQYLPPGRKGFFPVKEMVSESRFREYEAAARERGFQFVSAGSFVRSSYLAHRIWEDLY